MGPVRYVHRASRTEAPQALTDLAIRAGAALAALALGLAVRDALASNEDALRAILVPAASAIRLLFGREFSWQDGSGFVIRDARAFLGDDCSGLGWFSLAFPIIVFRFFPRVGTAGSRSLAIARFLAAAIGVSAAAAFLSNLVRVLASQALGPLKLALGLDFYSAHNAEGMLISVAALLICLRRFERRSIHD
jgi:exosortase K